MLFDDLILANDKAQPQPVSISEATEGLEKGVKTPLHSGVGVGVRLVIRQVNLLTSIVTPSV